MREQFVPMGMTFSFVDFTDLAEVRKAIRSNTKMIFSETPTNPILSLVDLEAISKIAKEFNCIHVCDSTFATPVMLRPLDHGVDVVIQSLTKFYDGHNMGVGGAVISKTEEHHNRMLYVRNMHGNIMAPQVAFTILQTMKTMSLRVKQQSATAMKIATFLTPHPAVTKVVHPG